MIGDFSELLGFVKKLEKKVRIGVVGGSDIHTITALLSEDVGENIVPVLIGDSIQIIESLSQVPLKSDHVIVSHAATDEDAAVQGVEMAKRGEIDVLMKGFVQTRTFLSPVVNKDAGIIINPILSHIAVFSIPNYNKLIFTSDGGMVPIPTLEQKINITKNTLEVVKGLGYLKPRISVLAAAENVNPKIPSSIEAKEIERYFKENYGDDCYIDGPLSLDLSLSKEITQLKKYSSEVAGQADILIGPDMTAMNILGKSFVVAGQGEMAGMVHGASIPIVMTSRGSSVKEKINSILLASIIGGK